MLTQKQKEYIREYKQRPESKIKQKEYNQRPETKIKQREYKKRYEQKPETKQKRKEWNKKHKKKYNKSEEGRKTNLEISKRYIKKLRTKCITFLGGRCVKCGFNDIRALQIDHINGGGCKEAKEKGAYWIYKNVLKNPQKYQLLCANCNWIKRTELGEVRGYIHKI